MDDPPARDDGTAQVVVSAIARQSAHGRVTMLESTARLVESNSLKKGDVLAAAHFAAVQAAKASPNYLPLLEPRLSGAVHVEFVVGENFVEVRTAVDGEADVATWMPALTAATVAALTIFDMCKAVDRTMNIGPVELDSLD